MPPLKSCSASNRVATTQYRIAPLALALTSLVACSSDAGSHDSRRHASNGYVWNLPDGFPTPAVPSDNPMSEVKVELGRRLFYDKRLSKNETYACATCHIQSKAFTDGLPRAIGSTGQVHPRGSMSIVNIAYANTFTWANNLIRSLEKQALAPMFGEDPIVELGLAGHDAELIQRLRAEAIYTKLFPQAFPHEADPIRIDTIVKAIAAFERTVISGNSAYDRYAYRGEKGALSPSALRGKALFDSERLECFHCHNGFNFSDSVTHTGKVISEKAFHNTGLFNIDGNGAYPPPNRGIFEISMRPDDMGRFKAPTLRNIEVTGPYMHDGSMATLEEVIDHYARGGRKITGGPEAGDGATNPLKSEFVRGFVISDDEKADVVEFLKSLTDTEFLRDPRFSDPWVER